MKLYDKNKIDWNNILFDNKALFLLLVPIVVEQLLNSFMGMVDTTMVSTVGSEAISAVSLVDSFNNLIIQVFSAMAAGAAIICSQYLSSLFYFYHTVSFVRPSIYRFISFRTFMISIGFSTNVSAPCSTRNSLSRKPQSTLIHGRPAFFAVARSTSESPT